MFRAVQQDNQRIARSCELVEQGLERVAVLSRSGLKSTTLINVRLAPTTGARDGHSRTAAQWQKKSFTGLRKESGSAPAFSLAVSVPPMRVCPEKGIGFAPISS